jgi:hypothetical protein
LREHDWSTELFDEVSRALGDAPFNCSSQGHAPDRVLQCTLTGQPKAMEFLTGRLLSTIAPALRFDREDRFNLRLEGVMDQAIWRRVNIGPLSAMGDDHQPWLWKRYSRYQVEKHDSERQERGRDKES